LGVGDGVIRLGFDDHAAGRFAGVDGFDPGAELDGLTGGPGGTFGEGGDLLDGSGFAPAGFVEDGLFVFNLGESEGEGAGFGGAVDDEEIGIEGVEDLAVFSPFDGDTAVGREFGRGGKAGVDFEDLAGFELDGLGMGAGEGEGLGGGPGPRREEGKCRESAWCFGNRINVSGVGVV
jgi:hypothetical protein